MSSKLCVFDIEGNGLDADRIWVLSAAIYSEGEWRLKSTHDYDEMRSFFLGCDTLVGHNIIRWDIPTVERILDIKIKARLIDTLSLSWYLEPYKVIHGLDDWGTFFDIPKPKITEGEWLGPLEGETMQQFLDKMTNRCQEDVKINCKLWDKQVKNLHNLYDGDVDSSDRFLHKKRKAITKAMKKEAVQPWQSTQGGQQLDKWGRPIRKPKPITTTGRPRPKPTGINPLITAAGDDLGIQMFIQQQLQNKNR